MSDMKLYIDGVDVYNDVHVTHLSYEMHAEKQADCLTMRFTDTKGLWSKWNPQEGTQIRWKYENADSGQMFVHEAKPENGLYTIKALSIPLSARTKRSKSWEGVRFKQLAQEIATNNGLSAQFYGVSDQVYPVMFQKDESDMAFLSRLCTYECCQFIVYNKTLVVYSEAYMESQSADEEIEIKEDGKFTYNNNRTRMYGSCEVKSGSYSGSFSDPSPATSSVYRPEGVRVSNNAEAARFAKGLLRDQNKYGWTGQVSKKLKTEYAACSVMKLKTPKAETWNGKVFVYRAIHDYMANKTTLYFRGLVEGY